MCCVLPCYETDLPIPALSLLTRLTLPSQVYHKLPLFDDTDLADSLEAFATCPGLMKADILPDFLNEIVQVQGAGWPKQSGRCRSSGMCMGQGLRGRGT